MGTLKTLLLASLCPSLMVQTPEGNGRILAIYPAIPNTPGDADMVQVRLPDGSNKSFPPMLVLPILKSFMDFRLEAMNKTGKTPADVLQTAADMIAEVRVAGRIKLKQINLTAMLEAPLKQLNPNAKGWLRINTRFETLWNPHDDAKANPDAWLPIQLPSLQTWLLGRGYAAGIPFGEYVTPEKALTHQFPPFNASVN